MGYRQRDMYFHRSIAQFASAYPSFQGRLISLPIHARFLWTDFETHQQRWNLGSTSVFTTWHVPNWWSHGYITFFPVTTSSSRNLRLASLGSWKASIGLGISMDLHHAIWLKKLNICNNLKNPHKIPEVSDTNVVSRCHQKNLGVVIDGKPYRDCWTLHLPETSNLAEC